ncbi:anthrone oxygenase family protein [Kitasatospora sp. NPDC049258]|uniref:anthrone oxygenase family protein n=1 Tax=Kitasatospora sp. NPDC049258 TaxID=3155394 RepID=UPI0034171EE9
MTVFRTATLVAATLATGLGAGLFYGYACSVMPGLARSSDRTFVEAMQRINVAILNGWFALSFGGAILLIVLAAVLQYRSGGGAALGWIVAAGALQLALLVVTMAVNVPLNNRLAAGGDAAGAADLATLRAEFEQVWVRWNVLRALAGAAALGCLAWALVLVGRTGRA